MKLRMYQLILVAIGLSIETLIKSILSILRTHVSTRLLLKIYNTSTNHIASLNQKHCPPSTKTTQNPLTQSFIIENMPAVLKFFNAFLKNIDLFPNSQFLRYNGEKEYTTATGGCISITVITIFIALFASMGLKTLERKIINTSISTEYEVDPQLSTIVASPAGGFMFGISIFGFNLNDPTTKIFNITLWQQSFTPIFNSLTVTQVPLVACTEAHYSFNQDILTSFKDLNMSSALCPPLDYQFTIKGKVTSSIFTQLRVSVEKCNNTIDPLCLNNTQFSALQSFVNSFVLVVPVVNSYINPGKQDYKGFYLEDQNYFSFNSKLGVRTIAKIEEDTIETDVSLMPYSDIISESIQRIPDSFRSENVLIAPNLTFALAEVRFLKSDKTTVYSRTFNKVDTYFSYVGGLIGTLIGLIFIIGKYNETAYDFSLAHKIFKDNQNEEVASSSFNLGYYILMPFKKLLNFCNCSPEWRQTQLFIETCEQISMQLDVTYIIRKLIFLDTALSKIFESHELEALYATDKPTLSQLKEQRTLHFARELLKHKAEKNYQNGGNQGTLSHQPEPIKEAQNGSTSNKEEPQHSQYEDLSSLSLSRRDSVIKRIEASVNRAANERKEGRLLSRRIMEDINEATLEQIVVCPHEQEEKPKIEMSYEFELVNNQNESDQSHSNNKSNRQKDRKARKKSNDS